MKEKLTISPEKPLKNFDQKSLDMARSRARILSSLFDQLPINYIESFGRIYSFITFEDAKPFGKDWPKYFKTAEDFQLYANLNPDWVGESIENLTAKFGDMSKGFYHFNLALDIFINKETKGFSNKKIENARKDIQHIATQKIETIGQLPQIRKTTIPEKKSNVVAKSEPVDKTISNETSKKDVLSKDERDDKIIKTILYLINDIRPSISKDKLTKLDSDIIDIILK